MQTVDSDIHWLKKRLESGLSSITFHSGSEITLDGGDLRSEASRRETLITELKEMLEVTSRKLMETKKKNLNS